MMGFLDSRILHTGWYYVDELGRYDLRCEIDECRQDALFEVGTDLGRASAILTCYMHISFAIEDTMLELRRSEVTSRVKTLETLKRKVPLGKKNGFEYD